MKPLTLDQLLGYEQWDRSRPVLRPLFIREKGRRRLAVGDHFTLLFENVQTVWYQVEEMIRIERLVDPEAIQDEVDTYNALLPGAGELSATLLIEYPDSAERDAALRRLVGLEQHLWLRIGERRVRAEFEGAQLGEEVVSAVQFVRFVVGGSAAERLLRGTDAAIEVDHPHMVTSAPITGELARALAEDLGA
jgi:hypothetical protein